MYFIFLIHMLKLLGTILGDIKLKIGTIITFNKYLSGRNSLYSFPISLFIAVIFFFPPTNAY